MSKEIIEVIESVEGEVDIPKPICPIVPLDIRCKTYSFQITSNKRKLSAKRADGTQVNYDDISPFYPIFENIKDSEDGNRTIIHFTQDESKMKSNWFGDFTLRTF